jgi:hypothetical protein
MKNWKQSSFFGMVAFIVLVFAFAACNKGGSSGSANAQSGGRVQSSPESDFEVRPLDDGKSVAITKYIGNKWEVGIPSKIRGLSVTDIEMNAFLGKNLTKVTIPNSVTTIAYSAFKENQLTTVTIPNSVTRILSSAFGNNQLTSVTIGNSVITIGDYAFENNRLTSVTIPNSVTSIGKGAFENNQLTSVTLGNRVREIRETAFAQNQLTSVTIGANVTLYFHYDESSFGDGFEAVYNNGKAAGTYTRLNTNSTTWTKQ